LVIKRVEDPIHVADSKRHCACAELITNVSTTAPDIYLRGVCHDVGIFGVSVKHKRGVIKNSSGYVI
jgi:hypothetical protein